MHPTEIRQSLLSDVPAIEALYPLAFPHEDLLPLLRALATSDAVSFVGFVDGKLASHAAFTACSVTGTNAKAALLGPVAVAPHMQQQGASSKIIQSGLQHLAGMGMALRFVLGDPAYYARFRFKPEKSVMPPYPLPEAWLRAWQSLGLANDAPDLKGTLVVPTAWRHEDLRLA
jgi:putative acetyltransferase